MKPKLYNTGLNLEREHREQAGDEWQFGASSLPSLVTIPRHLRRHYLPQGEVQRGKDDMQDCATRAPINFLEALFTYAVEMRLLAPENIDWLNRNGYVVPGKGVVFSDAYIAIKSGTTRGGNSLKAPLQAIHEHGLIPKPLLPLFPTMTWMQYHDPKRITPKMEELGAEFAARFTINYEQVRFKKLKLLAAEEMVVVAGHAWPDPVRGVYPRTDENINHAFLVVEPEYVAYDNYLDVDGDYIKQLAANYRFLDYGYRLFLSEENVGTPKRLHRSIIATIARNLRRLRVTTRRLGSLSRQSLLERIAQLRALIAELTATKSLYSAALAHLGRDVTPKDMVPDDVACAETVSTVIRSVIPSFPIIPGTYTLWRHLENDPRFRRVTLPMPGAIVISPTGTQPRTSRIKNGHVGIHGRGAVIMSNTSRTGIFEENFTDETWQKRYGAAGFPTYYYQLIK